jgi:DNA polymerase III sliding clamp (beta) subunit (PCNA family)
MTFQAALKKPQTFGRLVAILNELVDIVTMDITADGLSIVTFDSGHVFAVELFMSAKNAFVRYQCTNHMSVTIKTEHLHKIFRTVRNNNDDGISGVASFF